MKQSVERSLRCDTGHDEALASGDAAQTDAAQTGQQPEEPQAADEGERNERANLEEVLAAGPATAKDFVPEGMQRSDEDEHCKGASIGEVLAAGAAATKDLLPQEMQAADKNGPGDAGGSAPGAGGGQPHQTADWSTSVQAEVSGGAEHALDSAAAHAVPPDPPVAARHPTEKPNPRPAPPEQHSSVSVELASGHGMHLDPSGKLWGRPVPLVVLL
eukprot:365693-Chlamydomonas_euryale.AAC.8